MEPDYSAPTPLTMDDAVEWWFRLKDVYQYEDELYRDLNVCCDARKLNGKAQSGNGRAGDIGHSNPAVSWDTTKNAALRDLALQGQAKILAVSLAPELNKLEQDQVKQVVEKISAMRPRAEDVMPRVELLLLAAKAYDDLGNPRAAINCLHLAAGVAQIQRAPLALMHLVLAVMHLRCGDFLTARQEWAYGREILEQLSQDIFDYRQARRWKAFTRYLPELFIPSGSQPPPISLWHEWPPRPLSWSTPVVRPRARPRPLPRDND